MTNAATWLLFVHVFSAIWLGAGALGTAVSRAATMRARSLAEKATLMRLTERMALTLILPGSLAVGVTGIALVFARLLGWRMGWIHLSLTLWLAGFLIGTLYLRPRLRRMIAAADLSLVAGAPTPELTELAAARLPRILADVNLLIFVTILFLMIFKPF